MQITNSSYAYGLGASYTNVLQTTSDTNQTATDAEKTEQENSSSSIIDKSSLAGTNNPYYTVFNATSVNQAIDLAMQELGISSGQRVSFEDISDAREQMEDDFTDEVVEGLAELGLPDDIDFRLASDGNGGITVISTHPDKHKIEEYFDKHPELVERFNNIMTLSNVEESRAANNYDPQVMRTQIQMQSLSTWFAEEGSSSSFMAYESSNAWFSTGVDTIA